MQIDKQKTHRKCNVIISYIIILRENTLFILRDKDTFLFIIIPLKINKTYQYLKR